MTHSRYQEARTVSFVNAGTNFLLAIIKIIIGFLGNSHALIADGLHSFSDLFGDILVWMAAKAGGRDPDQDHPYGHQRIETLASIIIAIILLAVAASIVYDSIPHLLGKVKPAPPTIWVVIVAIISIVGNEWLYRYTLDASRKINSSLLLTYAWHNRGDAYVSVIVLGSVMGAIIGWVYLDAIGAIFIALLIAKISFKMIWISLRELIDTGVDEKTLHTITQCIAETPGVDAIHQLRTRTHSGNIFVDVHIIVDPAISVSEGHYISDQVYLNLHKAFPNIADITVHIDPENDEKFRPCLHLPNRPALEQQIKQHWQHLPGFTEIKKIQLHYLDGELHIELFLPQHLAREHDPATLQQAYRDAVANSADITQVSLFWSSDGQ